MKELILSWLFLPLDTPIYMIPFLGLVATFIYFALVMKLKQWMISKGWKDNKIARVVFFLFGGKFLRQDVIANIVCFSPIALHLPNKFSEGWTITSHSKAIIRNYLPIEDKLNWRKKWSLKFALFICKHLNNIDDGHCGKLRG